MKSVNLSLRRLAAFIAVAEELNFTRAAKRLYIAQQALSQQVSQLERELDVKLLDRTTRRVTLTPAGHQFLVDARELVANADAAIQRVRAVAGKQGAIRVGFTAGAIRPATRAILAEFQDLHPSLDISLREFDWQEPMCGLDTGESEIAFLSWSAWQPEYDQHVIQEVEACVAVPADHPIVDSDEATAQELAEVPMVVFDVPESSALQKWNIGRPAFLARSRYEWIAAIATGRGVGITTADAVTYAPLPGLNYVAATGLEPMRWAVAIRRETSAELPRALFELARTRPPSN